MSHLMANGRAIVQPLFPAFGKSKQVHCGLYTGSTTSNTPVPVRFGLPNTILPDGLDRSSKSPYKVASDKKAAVVSYEALSSGDGFVEMPFRLNGL